MIRASLHVILLLALGVIGPSVAAPSTGEQAVELTERDKQRLARHAPMPALPADPTNAVADDPAAAHFGQFLFFEKRFSVEGTISCATCHDPAQAFTDGEPIGSGMRTLTRHTPSLLNTAWNRWQFWDGRADTLWAQALHPIEHPSEYAGSRLSSAHVVHDDPDLRRAYESIFGPLPALDDAGRFPPEARPVPDDPEHPHQVAWAGMTPADRAAVDTVFANLGKAIAAYERRLVGAESPFDAFVEGVRTGDEPERESLSLSAQRGWKIFSGKANCRLCHFSPLFTDGEFHSTGVPPMDGGPLRDAGRYGGIPVVRGDVFNAAGVHSDARDGATARQVRSLVRSSESWGQFKTPTLRNVALTAPYMHQGQFDTLEEVVRFYSTLEDAVLPGHHQEQLLVPLNLSDDEIADLVAFLESLTGRPLPAELLGPPASPLLSPP